MNDGCLAPRGLLFIDHRRTDRPQCLATRNSQPSQLATLATTIFELQVFAIFQSAINTVHNRKLRIKHVKRHMSLQPSTGPISDLGLNQDETSKKSRRNKKEGVNGRRNRSKHEPSTADATMPSTDAAATIHADHAEAGQPHRNPRTRSVGGGRGRGRGRGSARPRKHEVSTGDGCVDKDATVSSVGNGDNSTDKIDAKAASSTRHSSNARPASDSNAQLNETLAHNAFNHESTIASQSVPTDQRPSTSDTHFNEGAGLQIKAVADPAHLSLPSIPSLPRPPTDGVRILMTRKNAPPRLAQTHTDQKKEALTDGITAQTSSDADSKISTETLKVLKKKKKAHVHTHERRENKGRHTIPEDAVANHDHPEAVSLTTTGGSEILCEATVLHRSESSVSIIERDALAGSVGGHIDLLKHERTDQVATVKTDKSIAKKKKGSSTKKLSTTLESEKEETVKQKPTRKSGANDATNDTDARMSEEMSNQRAARHFNKAVRECIELSDPDGIRALLHHKRNHSYALNGDVLEMLLKAYVVAAMFEDALYCLRNCTLPGTLRIEQTEKILQCMPQNLRHSSAFVAADMINALCIATEFEKAVHRTYFMRIVRGIALEFLEEATTARDRICSVPCERLVRSGDCVVDVRLKRGKRVTEIVVEPGYQLGVFIPDVMENRGIQAGDAVGILPYAGPYPISAESLDRNMIEATVTGIQPMVLRLQDKTNASLYVTLTEAVEGNVYRIDKLANRMGFNRQLASVVTFCTPSQRDENGSIIVHRYDNRRPAAALIKAVTAMDENIDKVMIFGGSVSRQNRSHELTSTASLCASAVPWNSTDDSDSNGYLLKSRADEDAMRDAARLALVKYGALDGLNASQRLAVEGAATNRLTLIQGKWLISCDENCLIALSPYHYHTG